MPVNSNAPLIVAAMPSELRHALDMSTSAERCDLGPWTWWDCRIDGRPVNLLLTGIGMVNAGAALARSLCVLQPEAIINFGCAGAHRSDISPGDVVIGDRYIHHRAVTILPDGDERYSGTPVMPHDTSVFVDAFEADPELLGIARAAGSDWKPDAWPVQSEGGRASKVHSGPLASADAWAQSTELIDRIHKEHGTLCEDMEAAALAQVASMHDIPFLAIKDISNNEYHDVTDHGEAGGPSLQAVEDQVGQRAFALVRRILDRYPSPTR